MLSNDEVDLKADEGEESYKKKYRELKKKLKYLVYVCNQLQCMLIDRQPHPQYVYY